MNNKEDLVKQVMSLGKHLNSLLRPVFPRVIRNLDLTVPQLRSLFFIACEKATSPGHLAEAMGVSPSSVTGIVDGLVRQGLVYRYENPDNRRMICLELTSQGNELLATLREERLNDLTEVLGRLSDEELGGLIEVLKALIRAAGESK